MNTILSGQQGKFKYIGYDRTKVPEKEEKSSKYSILPDFMKNHSPSRQDIIQKVKQVNEIKQFVPFKLTIKNLGYEQKPAEYILQSRKDDNNQFQIHDYVEDTKTYYIVWENNEGYISNVGVYPIEIIGDNLKRII